jgi:ribosomal protein S18 acetylase RimI-like enzyme
MSGPALVERYDPSRHSAEQLRALFHGLYEHLERSAGRRFLAEDAFDKWIAGYEKQGGRSRLIVVSGGERLTGFAEGSVRFPPNYYAAEPAGYVHHVYVSAEGRRGGLATALWRGLTDWFDANELTLYELHVVRGNAEALGFWRRLGFEDDNLQMRLEKGGQ